MNRRTIGLLAIMLVGIGGVEHGSAQEPMDSNRLTEAGCRRAEQLMAEPGDRLMRRRAMEYLARCAARGGEALARELFSMSTVSDTVLLNDMVREVSRIREASVLAASREPAADRSATLESRIAALRVLVRQASPGSRTWFLDYMLPIPTSISFAPESGHHGAAFPAGWWERTDSVLVSILEDSAESEAIRWAASRARLFIVNARPAPDLR